jgi:ABC-2 type transport system permease protein
VIHAIAGIVIRDLHRLTRQRGRFIGGLARPFLWVFLVGAGFEGIARTGDGYRAFAYPGGIAMAALFGGMLTGISTVYDREFGMLRLLLASPFGVRAALLGRLVSATLVGTAQGTVVLALAPLVLPMSPARFATGLLALVLVSAASAALGLLVASRLASVDSFGGVINVVLFPLLFTSGAFYPVATMPPLLRAAASANPITYMVDLLRHALARNPEFALSADFTVLAATAVVSLIIAAVGFDPERRIIGKKAQR